MPIAPARKRTGSPKGCGERMADMEITEAEADALIEMEKRFVDNKDWTFPAARRADCACLNIPRQARNFHARCDPCANQLTKATYQNRARQAIILMRLDLDGPPH